MMLNTLLAIAVVGFLSPIVVYFISGRKIPFSFWFYNDPVVSNIMILSLVAIIGCVLAKVLM